MSYKHNQRALAATESQPVHSVSLISPHSVKHPGGFQTNLNQLGNCHASASAPLTGGRVFLCLYLCLCLRGLLGVEMSPPSLPQLGVWEEEAEG